MSESIGVNGGNVWRPVKSISNNKFNAFLYKASALLWLLAFVPALVIIILGFVQKTNATFVQQKDFFTKFNLYGNGREMLIIVIILATLAVASLLFSSCKFGWTHPATYGISIISTCLVYVFLMVPSLIALDANMEGFKPWLKDQQGLSLLVNEESITPSDTLIMKGEDEKIYLVTFKTEDNKISIATKVQQ